MLISNFVTKTGINVRLPGSASGSQQMDKLIEITYLNDNEIVLDNVTMNINNLKLLLPQYYKNKDQVVRLSANKEISLQNIINIMDIIRVSGFDKITIATNRKPLEL
jgi:biopolymer transport protein ExbD